MRHNLSKMAVDIPALETTVEGKLRGGFSYFTHGDVSICGGINEPCRGNSICRDNQGCYNNHDSQACAGNRNEQECSNHGSPPTATTTSTSTSTSTSKSMSDIFSLF